MPLDVSPKTDETENPLATILEPLKRAVLSIYAPKNDPHGNPSLSSFFLENGRLPFVGDPVKPWQYRGWLIPYLQMSEAHPLVSPRYDYVLRTLDAGALLDEPLPQIHFVSEFSPQTKAGLKMLNTCLETVEYKSGSWNGIREFCEWLAFALGVVPEPSKLSPDVQEFLYRNFNLEPLLLYPSDYFGQILCETSHGKKNGFYPTPIAVVEMMVRMTCGDVLDGIDRRCELFSDPSGCGTGRMLLAGSNYSMRLYGMDIDYLCVLITKINLALYAPWFYIPASYFPERIVKPAENENNHTNRIVDMVKPPTTDHQPPTTLFDLNQFSTEKIKPKKNSQTKTYTTEIEQPSLFDFD